jgi:hypothetical protein
MFWSYSSSIQSWYWHISWSSDVVSPGDWLVCSVLFFCLPVQLKLWGELGLPDHAGWPELLISSADLCITLQLQLLGDLLPQCCGSVQFWMQSLVQEIISIIHYLPCFGGGFLLCLFTGIYGWGLFLCPVRFLRGRFSVPSAPSTVCVLWLFTVWFQFCQAVQFWMLLSGQEMISVFHYLPCFREWFIASPHSVFLPFLYLFTDSSHWD